MPNKRTLIRDAISAFIEEKIPSGITVLSGRHRILPDEVLPLINVVTGSETAEIYIEAPRRYKRGLEVNVEIYTKSKENIDQVTEEIMGFVEYIIDREDLFTLEGEVSEIIYLGSGVSSEGKESIRESAMGILRYTVEYYTDAGKVWDDAEDFDEIYASLSGLITTEIDDIHE